jgi:hypothetical protein
VLPFSPSLELTTPQEHCGTCPSDDSESTEEDDVEEPRKIIHADFSRRDEGTVREALQEEQEATILTLPGAEATPVQLHLGTLLQDHLQRYAHEHKLTQQQTLVIDEAFILQHGKAFLDSFVQRLPQILDSEQPDLAPSANDEAPEAVEDDGCWGDVLAPPEDVVLPFPGPTAPLQVRLELSSLIGMAVKKLLEPLAQRLIPNPSAAAPLDESARELDNEPDPSKPEPHD